ncbi:YchJ family protein [Methylocystis parvus]|uniref:YchJ family protein n=1 Tax=Methylocystis parvus TaxID=134 RepID=A0A6B8MB62_9HYPH|nr:YchJ family protein [Methylocystis parvus]QGM97900.1 YchJ family protein [Methylocystis parvus]WBK01788.1 YchJ family protein [Methylocystis parvus OBBP]
MTDAICPCRVTDADKRDYADCCKPFIEEGKAPATAEALMRSRYTAFVRNDIDYLEETLAPGTRHDFDRKSITHWAKQSQWLGLEILSTENGGEDEDSGYVEFVASFVSEGQRYDHRERSLFNKIDGRWYFQEEANRKNEPVVKGKQPGRNDPCPCGSGKKFKKCCGAAA